MSAAPREQMIKTAMVLFQRQGYCATSWRKLVQEAKTPWGSAHHYFPGGKEQIGVAAVELATSNVDQLIRHCFATQPDASAATQHLFVTSAKMLKASGFRAGCPITTVALETVSEHPVMAKVCRAGFDCWQSTLTDGLREHGYDDAKAKSLSTLILAMFEGALILSRVSLSIEPLMTCSNQIAGFLKH